MLARTGLRFAGGAPIDDATRRSGGPRPAASPPRSSPAAVVYVAVAGLSQQRLRRAALLAGWRRTGRRVDPAVAGNWGAWVTVSLLAALAVTSLWWLPPAEPLRRVAGEGSTQGATSFVEFFERQRLSRDGEPGGTVAGESLPARDPTPPDVERPDGHRGRSCARPSRRCSGAGNGDPSQSPVAYARVLGSDLPDHAGDLDELTGHFVEARYSDHPIGTGTAERTRAISRTLCRALKQSGAAQRPDP